jgi:hypothetical protein
MNLIERWFGHLDNKAIKRGVFLSVGDLQASIGAFLAAWNERPQPFVWTATVESIQEKLTHSLLSQAQTCISSCCRMACAR